MPMIADELEMPDELVEQMKEGTFTYEITGENGQLNTAGGSYGDAFPMISQRRVETPCSVFHAIRLLQQPSPST